jgi:transposase
MTLAPHHIGIDVSKDWLDVFDAGTQRASRIANTAPTIAAFIDRLPKHASLIFEATGPFDRRLHHAADAASLTVYRVNPRQARDHARACGRLAKTDAIDAKLLAALVEPLQLEPSRPVDLPREALTRLHRHRDQLVAVRATLRGQLSLEADPIIEKSLQDSINFHDRQIATFDAHIAEAIRAPAFAKTVSLMRTVKGVGPVTITTLVALMPELGACTAKEIGALAGLAPYNRDSGQYRGQRHIAGGRTRVRRAMYMAALAATRVPGRFRDFYLSVKGRCVHAKIAIIAVARKLLVTLNAMIKSGKPYRAEPTVA